MKIDFEKQDLLDAINIALKAVPSRTTMTILECIMIDARGDTILFTTNDTELGIETTVKGRIIEGGSIAVEAKFFADIARKMPEGTIHFQSDENYRITITSGSALFHIQGQDGEDFPFIPEIEKNICLELSQLTLRDMIRQTIFSTADGESNKIMSGELFEVRDNVLRLIALDGHRIAIRRVELASECDNIRSVIPGKTLAEIGRILNGGIEDMVQVYFEDSYVMFEFDRTIVVSRLIDGDYFDVDRMIAPNYTTKVKLDKNMFLNCIDRATLMTRESDRKPIILEIGEDIMKVRIQSIAGSLNDSLEIEKEGQDMKIAFNPKFFLDALRAIDDESITLYLINQKAPCTIRDEANSYLYLLLPVNFVDM
ncbi:MAG: DNA polymerase III subunit beta [Lachnospiraceae bacterium]|nr:DNA polymerase III subunit beta [Lachnospiraceae bacterium]